MTRRQVQSFSSVLQNAISPWPRYLREIPMGPAHEICSRIGGNDVLAREARGQRADILFDPVVYLGSQCNPF